MAPRFRLVIGTVSVLLLVLPDFLGAQGCIGLPIPDRAVAVTGQYSASNHATRLGAALAANLAGPTSLQAGYTRISPDFMEGHINSLHALFAVEVRPGAVSACPFVRSEYSRHTTQDIESPWFPDLTNTSVITAAGIGIGYPYTIGQYAQFTIFAAPLLLYDWQRTTLRSGDDVGTESRTEFGADLGIRLSLGRIFGGTGVSITEHSDPLLMFSIGFWPFGGR